LRSATSAVTSSASVRLSPRKLVRCDLLRRPGCASAETRPQPFPSRGGGADKRRAIGGRAATVASGENGIDAGPASSVAEDQTAPRAAATDRVPSNSPPRRLGCAPSRTRACDPA
jgi:hypothetical protein